MIPSSETAGYLKAGETKDFPAGSMKKIQLGAETILMVHGKEGLRAFQAKCPHEGAPLEEGTFCRATDGGEVLVCAAHKAVFSAASGDVLAPPSFFGLLTYPLRILGDEVWVKPVLQDSLKDASLLPVNGKPEESQMALIAGAGPAGVMAAFTLRKEGFAGQIYLLMGEEGFPYDRTALSKSHILVSGLLDDPLARETPLMLPPEWYERNQVRLLHEKLEILDEKTGRLTFKNGEELAPNHLIIATGAEPVRLDCPGADLENIFYLRAREDALGIARVLTPGETVVLIGDGWINLEIAGVFREQGLGVIILARHALPLEKALGREISLELARLFSEEGVAWIADTALASFEGGRRVRAVLLDDGTRLPCHLVVVGIGAKARIPECFGCLPRDSDGALVADDHMRVEAGRKLSFAVYAAGDVAAVRDGARRWPAGHWRSAEMEGRRAACSILGKQTERFPTPWFATEFFGKKIEYLGWGGAFDRVMVEGSLREFDFFATFLRGREVVGFSASGEKNSILIGQAAVDFEGFCARRQVRGAVI